MRHNCVYSYCRKTVVQFTQQYYVITVCVCRVSNSLVSAYEAVYELLDDPTAGYAEQGGSAVVKHTPTQVRTILGVL